MNTIEQKIQKIEALLEKRQRISSILSCQSRDSIDIPFYDEMLERIDIQLESLESQLDGENIK